MGQLVVRDVAVEIRQPQSQGPIAKGNGFGIAVRLPETGGASFLFAGLACLFAFAALCIAIIGMGDDGAALIAAKDAHIQSLERTNTLLAEANERLENVASLSSAGLDDGSLALLAGIVMVAVGMTLVLVPKLALGGVLFVACGCGVMIMLSGAI